MMHAKYVTRMVFLTAENEAFDSYVRTSTYVSVYGIRWNNLRLNECYCGCCQKIGPVINVAMDLI